MLKLHEASKGMQGELSMIVILVLVFGVAMFALGFTLGFGEKAESGQKTQGMKKMSDLSDDELFALQMAVFNEISKRGAEMLEVFEEFEGDKKK